MKYGPVSYIIIGKRGESVTVETIIRPIAHIKSDFTDKFGINWMMNYDEKKNIKMNIKNIKINVFFY